MALFRKKADARPGRKAFEKLPARTRSIVFYAEDGGSWPHFEPIVRELTASLGREVCYLTSSPDDPIFLNDDDAIHAFEVGDGFGRAYLFQMMEVGALVATVPQLGIKVLPRSKRAAAVGTTYLYVFHSMMSTHMIYEPDGFDHYDTVLCVGPYMQTEIRAREAHAGLAAKELVDHGYGRLDAIVAAAAKHPRRAQPSDPPIVLVAPSWGPTCIIETCGVEVVSVLLDAGYHVIVRPHPMTRKESPDALGALVDRFSAHAHFELDDNIAAQESLHRSDVMVSDWSGAALEYAFGLERPVLFVDVPRKVNNPHYEELAIEPFEVSIRERLGRVVSPAALDTMPAAAAALLAEPDAFAAEIRRVRDENIFNVGRSARIAAEVIASKADAYLHRLERGA
jgi:hypothetical protein